MSDSITIQNSDGETFAEVIDVIGVSEIKKAFHKSIKEGSLHKWFKGSKSKDGKPGWVNVVTGGTCASDKPGEGTPKCVSSSKRASMTKAERLSASRRKKKADPGQQGKSGAAKPTYVATDKKKKMKEGYVGTRSGMGGSSILDHEKDVKSGKLVRSKIEKKQGPRQLPKNYKPLKDRLKEDMKRDEYGDPIGGPKISKKQLKKNLTSNTPDEQHNTRVGESTEITEADKKGKGSGKKDACYHKVKSRYSVWPSAYASGALVKCRKKGAANWGNKSEEYIPEEGYDHLRDRGMIRPSKDKKDATTMPPSKEMRKTQKVNKGPSAYERVKKKYKGQIMDIKKEEFELDEGQKCWKGYEKKGTKKMFGKTYNNCVKKEEYSDWREEIEYLEEIPGASAVANYIGKMGVKAGAKQIAKRGAKRAAKRAAIKVAGKSGGKAAKKAGTVAARETKKAAAETAAAVGAGAAQGLKKRKEKFVAKVKRKSEEIASGEGKKKPEIVNEFVDKQLDKIQKSAVDTAQKSGAAMSKELVKGVTTAAAIGAGAYVGAKILGKGVDALPGGKKKKKKKKKLKEGAAWTKKSGKNPSGGLNEKGRKSYERENPGSDLKAPSKKVGNKRRSSFCARMKGMKKKLTSAKTANDPDSRINKSLRKWNC